MASETFADELRAAVAGDKFTLYTELMLQAADLLDHKDEQINTRPAPAATDTGLETYREEYAKLGRALDLLARNASSEDIRPAIKELSGRVFRTLLGLSPSPLSSKEGGSDTGLVTVAKQWKVTAKNWSGLKPEISEPFDERELVTRSQAEAIIAAEREAHKHTDELLISAVNDCHTKDCHIKELQADNEALTARVKELEADLKTYQDDTTEEVNEKIDLEFKVVDLEAKLAAATELLREAFNELSDMEKLAFEFDCMDRIASFLAARAVLGGEPS